MKTIRILFLVFIIGIILISISVMRTHINSFSQPNFRIKVNPYSLSFYSSDLSQEIFKVSPFDDYYYAGILKEHFANDSSKVKFSNPSSNPLEIIRTILYNQKQISWKVTTNDGEITYQISTLSGHGIKLSRKISNFSLPISNLGQSIVLCKDCIVTDNLKRFYVNQESLDQNYINLSNNGGFTITSITNKALPTNITNLIILDYSFNPKLTIPISSNQQVFFDQKWNLIEIKTRLNQNSQTDQTIYFD